jgi:hypothetical protein
MSGAPRFSDRDLIDIVKATRLRSPLKRLSGPDYDCIELLIPHRPGASFRIQKDATGYALLFVGADEWKLLASGTLAECLRVFGSDPRFSLDELATISRFAGRRIDHGEWLEVEREGSPRFDRILIYVVGEAGRYSLERDATGATRLLRHRADGEHVLVHGTLRECLSVFEPPQGGAA